MWTCFVTSQHIQELLGAFILKLKICNLIMSKKKNLILPNGDPRDIFFYPTLTLLIDLYRVHGILKDMNRLNAFVDILSMSVT